MVDVRYSSELGRVLSSRHAALLGTFGAEPTAIPGLEATRPACQRAAYYDPYSFYVYRHVQIGWEVRDGDDGILLLLLLEAPRYVRLFDGAAATPNTWLKSYPRESP